MACNPPAKVEEALLLTIKLVIVVEPAAKVEEERSTPETWKLPPTVEEAEARNPPPRVARLATDKVEEADNGPEIFKLAEKVEEAVERVPTENV